MFWRVLVRVSSCRGMESSVNAEQEINKAKMKRKFLIASILAKCGGDLKRQYLLPKKMEWSGRFFCEFTKT